MPHNTVGKSSGSSDYYRCTPELLNPRGLPWPGQQSAFWDNLSTVWLTERALRELDRRNTQGVSNRLLSLQRRPVTRRAVTEWTTDKGKWQPATDYLAGCTKDRMDEIKQLAKHGGPDLSDLKGVRLSMCLLLLANNSAHSTRYLSTLSIAQ
jgi:hypothetical protein